ncbi:fungal-specific transcription factor domain-containing protein [Talaromyces proteolyticus]|uniref:Fungal-specific transcription factor domain-containing protein n=1 Tax=Talaromyces proteolyticus TaxID=1131652 RepID=A0AAD4Q0F1_9EURO|nr:fungal-specific transcription factor domain-containing protein [Talaromyces proteolyticus]KAH8697577.1 fungal-specific transcription factor domain-containing protein [Talaromyces proteolyticus]
MHACERCYSRKTKCDRRLPECGSCIKSRSSCQYPNKRRDRQLQQEYLKSLEVRLKELEKENEQLRGRASSQVEDLDISVNVLQSHQSTPNTDQRAPNQLDVAESHDAWAQQSPEQAAGSLQRTPGEEARYLGSSNGVDFVDVVERVVDSSHTASGLFGRVSDSHRMLDRVAFPSIPQTARLVDQEVAMPLINSYFAHWHLIFPLLYRPGFMQMVQNIYSDPHFYQQNTACAFAFDIVLALGSVPSKRVEWSYRDVESHFARALIRLNEVSSLHDIRSLQALLLYCIYGIHASLRDTSSEMWEVLGKATRLCVEIGLHHKISRDLPRCQLHVTGPIPVSVQVEMQRRCFWCYHNLERIVSISLGRPLALHDDDIHVRLPSAADDEALDKTSTNTFSSSQATSPFLMHILLRKIQSKIHRFMYTSRSVQVLPLHERQAIRRELFNELQDWRKNISLLPLPPADSLSAITCSYLHPSWYQALYHSGCLQLFRPSATFPATEGLESYEDMDDVLQIIWNSSRLVLAKYFELLCDRHLNYSWVCLYTIFIAGLANVYSVGCCAQRRKRGIMAFLPSFFDVVSDVRDCSNILTAICERWGDARGSCDIFNQLSMSALKGLVATSFHQKTDKTAPVSRNNQTIIEPQSMTSANGEMRDSAVNGRRLTPQTLPSPGYSGLDQYTSNSFAPFDPIVDFQQMFLEMQETISTRGQVETDEVMLGFSQEWFER